MKRTDLAYTAGIIDGEGSISIRNTKNGKYRCYVLRVDVGSTDEWLPMWLKFAYGGSVFNEIREKPASPLWRWTITTRQAKSFLGLILPYLQLKRPQAEIAIRFQARKHRDVCRPKPKAELVLEEADAILLKSMHSAKNRQVNQGEID